MHGIADWLRSLGLGQYTQSFVDNGVDISVLCDLTDQDLKDLGVLLGHRRKILRAISELGDPPLMVAREQKSARRETAERRQLTLMFCDLVGSTALATQLDPEDMREVIRGYQSACWSPVTRYEGFVAKFMGDGVLAYFGFPRAHEDDAERAVRAGLEIIGAVRMLKVADGAKLEVRIGVATGLVVVGDLIGEGASQEQAVVGETPNLAARLQALAEPGTIVVSGSTRQLLGELFKVRDLGRHEIKGYATPVVAWSIEGLAESDSRFEAARAARLTGFVGRGDEIELLLDRKNTAWRGAGQIALLSGEAGIGKSRLAALLDERIGSEPHTRLRYQCSPYHSYSAFYPFIAQIERAAEIRANDLPERRLDKLESVLEQGTADVSAIAPLFSALLSIPSTTRYPPLTITAAEQRRLTFEALLNQLEGLARRQPVFLLFEDAHWADASSIELLNLAVVRICNLPVLVVITFRPEFEPPWVGLPNVTTLQVGRLARPHVQAMVEQVTGGRPLPKEVMEQIIAKADGIPLFIEELTRAVLEAGILVEDLTGYRLQPPLPPLAVPATLHDSLMARLDRLSPVKEIAQVSAVIGREFPYTLLRAVINSEEGALRSAIATLEAADLLLRSGDPPDAGLTFKHALVQEAAYESLLKSRRQVLHCRVAEVMLDHFPTIAESQPEVIAHHLTQAGSTQAAVEWWGTAGERARRSCAHVEAIAYLEKALGLADEVPAGPAKGPLRLRLQITYGQVLRVARGYLAPETAAAFARAREIAAETDDISERLRMQIALHYSAVVRADLATMREQVEAFRVDAERHGQRAIAVAFRLKSWVYWFEGNYVGAREYLEKALAAYGPGWNGTLCDFEDIPAVTMCILPLVLWALGDIESSRRLADEVVAGAVASKLIPSVMTVQVHRVAFEAIRNDPARAAVHAKALIDLSEEHRMPLGLHLASLFEGWIEWYGNDRDVGLAKMEQSFAQWRAQELNIFLPLGGFLLAKAKMERGRAVEGLRIVDDLLAETSRIGQRWLDAELHRLRGEILLQVMSINFAEAEAEFDQALTVARAQKARTFELRAAIALGRLFRDTGRESSVFEVFGQALTGFSKGPELPEVEEAELLLASVVGTGNRPIR
jgi:class 3 adenylate cyclase/tetratricopeptide (TPR) repeat protein